MRTRCLLSPEMIEKLHKWAGSSFTHSKMTIPMSSLILSFEDSKYSVLFTEGKNSVKASLFYDKKEMLTARITHFEGDRGRKIYTEYISGVSEFEKKRLNSALKFSVNCMLLLSNAYRNSGEDSPFVFVKGVDTKSHEEILLVKHFAKPGGEARPHKSPEEPFSVKGHYRHLKSGKVVWVRAYTKNKDI